MSKSSFFMLKITYGQKLEIKIIAGEMRAIKNHMDLIASTSRFDFIILWFLIKLLYSFTNFSNIFTKFLNFT